MTLSRLEDGLVSGRRDVHSADRPPVRGSPTSRRAIVCPITCIRLRPGPSSLRTGPTRSVSGRWSYLRPRAMTVRSAVCPAPVTTGGNDVDRATVEAYDLAYGAGE